MPAAGDARIVGSRDFVEGLLAEAARREEETLRLGRKVIAVTTVARQNRGKEGVGEEEPRSGTRTLVSYELCLADLAEESWNEFIVDPVGRGE